jgi:hypothetical protein
VAPFVSVTATTEILLDKRFLRSARAKHVRNVVVLA